MLSPPRPGNSMNVELIKYTTARSQLKEEAWANEAIPSPLEKSPPCRKEI